MSDFLEPVTVSCELPDMVTGMQTLVLLEDLQVPLTAEQSLYPQVLAILPLHYIVNVVFNYNLCVCLCVLMYAFYKCMSRSQRTAYESQFFPSIIWIPGIELRLSDFTH